MCTAVRLLGQSPFPRRWAQVRLQAIARLQQATSAAPSTLLKMMLDPATPASTKVRAAECIMNHAVKSIEIEDIEDPPHSPGTGGACEVTNYMDPAT
jgi:hypothetical protein